MVRIAVILSLVSQTFGLPQGLLSGVCYVESNHDARAMHVNDGGSSSVGACQIKLATARLLGFKGSEQALRRVDTNVYYAGKYLRYQLDRYGGDIPKAVSAYNAGTHRVSNKRYVVKVFKAWAERR